MIPGFLGRVASGAIGCFRREFPFDVATYWLYDGHEKSWVTRAYMGLGHQANGWSGSMKEPAKTAGGYEQ